MGDSTDLAILSPEDLRQKAIEKIKKYQSDGALVYVRPEDLQTQGMFFAVPVMIPASESDFHNIKGGKLMPKGHHTQKIAHATGTSIPEVSTHKDGKYVWVGTAKGKRRMPDGTMAEVAAEYEFDAEHRAEEDFLNDPSKYPNDVAKRRHVLELTRFARQRAETGASLRVIRKLAGIPTAFDRNDIQKAMVFARIEINSDRLLANPATAGAAVQHALGVRDDLFQPSERNVTPERGALPPPEAQESERPDDAEPGEQEGGFMDGEEGDIPFGDEPEDEVTILRRWFETTAMSDECPADTKSWIEGFLAKDESKDVGTLTRRKEQLGRKMGAKVKGGAS